MSAATARGERAFVAAVVAVFLLLGLVGVLNHEMWRDELEIWLVARDADSLPALFDNMSTEAHPALWYLLTYALSRFTDDPASMQLLHLLLAAGAVFVFAGFAPFDRLHRALFCFGYYAFYEFSIISRNYVLVLLLSLVFCALFRQWRRHALAVAAVLFLLANSHLYGAIAAGCFAVLLALELRAAVRRGEPGPGPREALAGAVIAAGVLVGVGHVYYQARLIGPTHNSYVPGMDLPWLADCVSAVYYGYVPLPRFGDPHFWNTNLLWAMPEPARSVTTVTLAALLYALSVTILRRRPAVLAVFALGSAAMLLITLFQWYGWARHHGQLYLLFVACWWLSRVDVEHRETAATAGLASRVLTVVMALQVVAGAYAWVTDLVRPFSNASRVGAYLREPGFADAVLVGSLDYAAQGVAAYVDREIYYPQSRSFGTFVRWGPERQAVPSTRVLEDAVALLRERGRDVVVILNFEVQSPRQGEVVPVAPDARVEGLARFEGAIVPDEDFFVYRFFAPPR